MWQKTPPLDDLQSAIRNPSYPIGQRMRAAYFLRQIHTNKETQQEVVDTLSMGLQEKRHGSLMRHEFAYVMGQLKDERCCETLEKVLLAKEDCVMVRHEAAEALGAIGAQRSKVVLQRALASSSDTPEIAETCQIALEVMAWRERGGDPKDMPAVCACMLSPYSSVDPAPPDPLHGTMTFTELGDLLCDPERPMFERYRAMFSLRNRGGEDAVMQLCRALTTDTSSALLRHEVAYVLGQMQHPKSVEALEATLHRMNEHMMVRHESAEALGAIDGRWDDVERILQGFANDDNDIVRESCLVALDAADYWGHNQSSVNEVDTPGACESFASRKADRQVLVNHFNVKE